MAQKTLTNPLDFNQFNLETCVAELQTYAQLARARQEEVVRLPASFENTILGIQNSDLEFDALNNLFQTIKMSHKDLSKTKEWDNAAEAIVSLSSDLESSLFFSKEIFSKVKEVYDQTIQDGSEKSLLIKEMYKMFVYQGALLSDKDQALLKSICEEEGRLAEEVDSSIKEDQAGESLIIDNLEELSGIPQNVIESAQEEAKNLQTSGWVLNNDSSVYEAVMTYAKNRDLREKFFKLFRSVGQRDNEYNLEATIRRLLELRQEKAKIFGEKSFADMILKERMALSEDVVLDFLSGLSSKVNPRAEAEAGQLAQLAKEDGIENFSQWDLLYYQNKFREKQLGMEFSLIPEYFPYPQVWRGLQTVLTRLYGIRFEPVNLPVYHDSVKAYKVLDEDQSLLGVLYLDPYARPQKDEGAWASDLVAPEAGQMAFVQVACNFTRPTQSTPSLLSLEEVKTLFHEMGHALHVLFSKAQYASLGGFNVAWDFVELPSQIMENFVLEEEVLSLISSHYKTGEKLPQSLAEGLKKASQLATANDLVGFTYLSKLDLWLHSRPAKDFSFENCFKFQAQETLVPYPANAGRYSSFSHIYSGGYEVGYYSYLWAEVLDADAYSLFKENGVLSREIANRFRKEVLSQGSRRPEMTSFKAFMQRDLSDKAFLSRKGL